MTNITKSAKRLLKTIDGVYCGMQVAPGKVVLSKDVIDVANAYLAEHPADDALPIDELWLRGVGFKPRGIEGDLWLWPLHWRHFSGEVVLQPAQLEIWHGVLRGHPKTRGDLRRLCAALGINLKEQPCAADPS